jgi:SAM-dependent methyltransferase
VVIQVSRKLHLGCGLNAPDGWINVDASWNAWLAQHPLLRRVARFLRLAPARSFEVPWPRGILIHDVRKRLPFAGDSVSGVYASHVLEHLYLDEADRLLRECFRVLEPGGVLRMVVPDLEAIVGRYLSPSGAEGGEDRQEPAADRLNRALHLRADAPASGTILYRAYSALKEHTWHKWMYDAESLVWHFERAGFVEVRRMSAQQSRIPDIAEVETLERARKGAGLCVEGVKPASGKGAS